MFRRRTDGVSLQVWLQYQCLWDMQPENIYSRLGEDLNKWQALLVQIRKARGTFDNAETRKEFGPAVIDYGKVRRKRLRVGSRGVSHTRSRVSLYVCFRFSPRSI